MIKKMEGRKSDRARHIREREAVGCGRTPLQKVVCCYAMLSSSVGGQRCFQTTTCSSKQFRSYHFTLINNCAREVCHIRFLNAICKVWTLFQSNPHSRQRQCHRCTVAPLRSSHKHPFLNNLQDILSVDKPRPNVGI